MSAAAPARRLLTDAEYRKLTPQQRIALGLDEPSNGAPADFGGTVLANPDNVRPQFDTDSATQPTRLPDGTNFQHGNFSGAMPRDVSNPPNSQLAAPTMRTVGADMSSTPVVTPQQDWFAANAPKSASGGGDWFDQNAPKAAAASAPDTRSFLQRAATQPSQFSRANPLRYVDELGQGMAQGVEALAHPMDTAKAIYKTATTPIEHDPAGDKPLLEGLGDVADTVAQGYGQAATAGAVSKVVGKAADVVISGAAKSSASRAVAAVKNVTPKQAAQVAGGFNPFSWTPHNLGHVAEALLGPDRANTPIFTKAASLDEATDALAETIARDRAAQTQAGALGKLPATSAQPAAATGEALGTKPVSVDLTSQPAQAAASSSAPKFTVQDRAAAKSLLEDALKTHTGDVVDQMVPGKNAAVKAQIDFYLKKGDVGGAESALDTAAKKASPAWTPLDRQPVPSTNEIRARVQAEAKAPKVGSSADAADDRAIQQEMNWNLERHGWAAESEARREFIARNSTGATKGGLTQAFQETQGAPKFAANAFDLDKQATTQAMQENAAGKLPKGTTLVQRAQQLKEQLQADDKPMASGSASGTAAQPAAASGTAVDDLTSILQKSLDAVRKKKAQQ